MGGAMDLVRVAKRVVVAIQHSAKGQSKIVRECTLPLTSSRAIDLVVTELAVISFTTGRALVVDDAALAKTVEQGAKVIIVKDKTPW